MGQLGPAYTWTLDDVIEVLTTRFGAICAYNHPAGAARDATVALLDAYRRWDERRFRLGEQSPVDGLALVEAFETFNKLTWKIAPPSFSEIEAAKYLQETFPQPSDVVAYQPQPVAPAAAEPIAAAAYHTPEAQHVPTPLAQQQQPPHQAPPPPVAQGGGVVASGPAELGGGSAVPPGTQTVLPIVGQGAGSAAPAAVPEPSAHAEGGEAPGRRLSLRTFPEKREWGAPIDASYAACAGCPFEGEREHSQCTAQRPEDFNGLVIVGEGPGQEEALERVPFVGRSGKLLNRYLDEVGLSRTQTYVTNATLCKPPVMRGMGAKEAAKRKKEMLMEAVQHCRERLLIELEQVNPRVIFTVGGFALDALTGRSIQRNRHHDILCHANGNPDKAPPGCTGVKTWKLWSCSKCKKSFEHLHVPQTVAGVKPDAPGYSPCEYGCGLEPGKAPPKKAPAWRPKKHNCPGCDGKKKIVEPYEEFKSEWSIGGDKSVAGGVFFARDLQIADRLAEDAIVVPTYHPSFMLRPPKTKGDKAIGGQFLLSAFHDHLLKVKRFLVDEPIFEFSHRVVRDPQEFLAWAYGPGTEGALFEVDIETDSKEAYDVRDITCIGFGIVGRSEDRIVLPTAGMPIHHDLVQAACRLLSDPTRKKLLQNGFNYDCIVIPLRWGVHVHGYVEDTQVAHTVLRPDEPHHLQHLGGCYTDVTPWKPPKVHKGKQVFESAAQLHLYNAKDVRVTGLAFEGLLGELQRTPARILDGNLKAFRELGHSMEDVYRLDMLKAQMALAMGDRGVPVDREAQLKLGAEVKFAWESALSDMQKMVGRLPPEVFGERDETARFNPASQPQLSWALFDQNGPCRLAPTLRTENGGYSTSAEALLPYVSHPFVARLFDYRSNFKIHGTYIEKMPIGTDFRVRPHWKPQGTRTGRWSSSPNLQNWPKWLRAMVKAPPGRAFIGADYSQLELRILAALCGDPEMIRRCRDADEGRKLEPEWDPHSYVAAISLGAAFTDLNLKDPAHNKEDRKCRCETCTRKHYRDVTKRTVYGLNYGAGEETILAAIYDGGYDGPPIQISMIAAAKRGYFEAFKRVEPFREGTLEAALRYQYITDAVLGRYRVFPLGEIEAPIAYNYPIQATAASIVDIAMWKLYNALPQVDPSAFIWAQVHDAIYVECDERLAPQVAACVEGSMSCAVTLVPGAEPMPLPAAAQGAYDWKNAA